MRNLLRYFSIIATLAFMLGCDPATLIASSPQLIDKAGQALDVLAEEFIEVDITSLRIRTASDMNRGIPVPLDVVFFDNKDLEQELLLLDGRSWFKSSNLFAEKHKDESLILGFEFPRSYDTGKLTLNLDTVWSYAVIFVGYDDESVLGRYVISKSGFLDIQLNEDKVVLEVFEE